VELDVEARVRQGVKAVLEEMPEEEMTQHLKAGYRELTTTRRGELRRLLLAQPPDTFGQDRAP
jgi:transposase-like protein